MARLMDTKLFLLDMDGTFYLGDELLPGAKEFLAVCGEAGIRYTFLTNNSSRSRTAYIEKLAKLGVNITEEQMFTSGDATLLYMAEKRMPKRILLVGTPSLEAQFVGEGYELARPGEAGAAVLGFDTTLTYEKLCHLCDAVHAGLPYIATHPDFNCPVQGGYIPDIGAVIAFVKASTGREPDVVVGKPSGIIAKAAAARAGLAVGELCMVGDRLYTDIALGASGVRTALVLCGESTRADLDASGLAPDFVFDNLAGMAARLREELAGA